MICVIRKWNGTGYCEMPVQYTISRFWGGPSENCGLESKSVPGVFYLPKQKLSEAFVNPSNTQANGQTATKFKISLYR
jgi:hypothetical protein